MYLQLCLLMCMVLQHGESFDFRIPMGQSDKRVDFCDIYNPPKVSMVAFEAYKAHRPGDAVPECLDWRKYEIVRKVKHQYSCGACWAFTIIAAIESHIMIHLGYSETLSEQFLVDCSDESKGCNRNSLLKNFGNIVAVLGGVLRESDYFPYANKQLRCRWNGKNRVDQNNDSVGMPQPGIPNFAMENSNAQPVNVVGFRRVRQNEELMMEYVYRYGPLAAAINSQRLLDYSYGTNYIDEPSYEECDPNALDHTVLIVGYNTYVNPKTNKAVPYWILKNSWGDAWGDQGFYYLVRGRNACGIAFDVSFPYVN